MKILILFYFLSLSLIASPIDLINSLKEEMNPQNKQLIMSLSNIEIKKNNKEIAHLKNQMEINHGGKLVSQIQRKKEIQNKIEELEKENELLAK
jgi:hypothetical protein